MKASNGIRRSKYLRQSDPNMAEGCVEEQGNGWVLIFWFLLPLPFVFVFLLFFCICICICSCIIFVFVFLIWNRKCISSTSGRPVPSINDNGSTRSVVHTPDKVTLLKKRFENNFLWLKMSSGKIYSEPQPFPCSWTDSWKITSTPYSAAFRSWFQGLKSNQFYFSIKPTKNGNKFKTGKF